MALPLSIALLALLTSLVIGAIGGYQGKPFDRLEGNVNLFNVIFGCDFSLWLTAKYRFDIADVYPTQDEYLTGKDYVALVAAGLVIATVVFLIGTGMSFVCHKLGSMLRQSAQKDLSYDEMHVVAENSFSRLKEWELRELYAGLPTDVVLRLLERRTLTPEQYRKLARKIGPDYLIEELVRLNHTQEEVSSQVACTIPTSVLHNELERRRIEMSQQLDEVVGRTNVTSRLTTLIGFLNRAATSEKK